MTDILLVRHGQTDWNVAGRIQGQSDIPLNQIGINQANIFAERFNGDHYEAVFSSDMQRAIQTAHIIAERLNVPVFTDKRLREVNHGRWEGMFIKDLLDNHRHEYEAFRNDPINSRPPGGETLSEAAGRMEAAVTTAAVQFPTQRIVLVSHGLALAVLLCKVKKIPLHQSNLFKLNNCAGELIHW
jgi:broad specificity phosphatase PhoE